MKKEIITKDNKMNTLTKIIIKNAKRQEKQETIKDNMCGNNDIEGYEYVKFIEKTDWKSY